MTIKALVLLLKETLFRRFRKMEESDY